MLKTFTFLVMVLISVAAAPGQEPAPSPAPEKGKLIGGDYFNPDSVEELDKKLIAAGVLKGKAIKVPTPVYPREARLVCAEGPVTVEVIIDEEGKVILAEATSGNSLLRAAAETAALSAIFVPTTLGGKPVKVTGTINYNFVSECLRKPPDESALVPPGDKDKVWAFGATISVIRLGDQELIDQFSEGGFEVFWKDVASDLPEKIKSLRLLFDQVATAKPAERPAAASRLFEAVNAHFDAEEKWQAEIGVHIGILVVEMARVFKTEMTGAIDSSKIESALRSIKSLLASAPPGALPGLVLRFRGIALFADTAGMNKPDRLELLWNTMMPLLENGSLDKKD